MKLKKRLVSVLLFYPSPKQINLDLLPQSMFPLLQLRVNYLPFNLERSLQVGYRNQKKM